MLTEGQILERKYRIGRLLQSGGMGSVFEAEHTLIKRQVAIKVLHGDKPDSENAKRFEREAEAAGRIGSDHIVEVLDFGTTPEGDRFMVMEFLVGETLKARLQKRSRLTPSELVPLVTQILEGLAAAHDAGIIHRDLKPDNLFILREKAGRQDFVKIVDFGISKFSALSSEGGQMTQTGAVMGTPFYMSPEQARSANEVDARSDLYAIGVILYEAMTGVRPFLATTLTELLFKIVFETPPHPSTVVPDLDRDFIELVMKAMARAQSDRFQSAREMKTALEQWLRTHATVAPGTAVPTLVQPGRSRTALIEPPASSSSMPTQQVPPPQGFSPVGHTVNQTYASASRGVAPTSAMSMAALAAPAPSVSAPMLDTHKGWAAAPPAPPAPRSSHAGLLVAIGALTLALGAAGAFMYMRSPTSTAGKTIPLPTGGTVSVQADAPATATPTTGPAPATATPSSATPSSAMPSSKTASAASVAASTATPSSTASALASAAAPGAPHPAASTKPGSTAVSNTPPPSGTVKDLGY